MKEKLAITWAVATFGSLRARSSRERAARLLEESIELAQALGLKRSDCVALIDQVYAKPSGDVKQEVGGVAVTLAALCGLLGLNIEEQFATEFARCIEKQDLIREKNKTKLVVFNED